MAKSQGNRRSLRIHNQKQDIEQKKNMSMVNYQDDEDYDEAFKNLLRPIEIITRTNYVDLAHFDLVKELDSYIHHLKISPGEGSSTFVDAALMIQNVNVIYQRKVDEIVDETMKLIAKFQAYRTNKNGIEDVAEVVDDKKKKKEKEKKRFFSSFEPIEIEIAPMKIFDCKKIDVSKLPPVPDFVLNTNIKVTNKYNGLMPHIINGNGVKIGKKYEFKISGPVNGRLAVNESTHCISNGSNKRLNYLSYLQNNDSLSMDVMDVDEENSDEMCRNSPEPAVFEQTITGNFDRTEPTEEVCVANAMEQSPAKLVNANKVVVNKAWEMVETQADNIYKDRPFAKKKISKRKLKINQDKKKNGETYIPSYIPREEGLISLKEMKPNTPDPAFKTFIRAAQKKRRSELMKMIYKQRMEALEKSQAEESGYNEFKVPIYMGDLNDAADDDDNMYGIEDREEPETDHVVRENILTYRKNVEDMKKFEQNEEEMEIENLEMRKRVQAWHAKIGPILDEEEKKGSDFDIHEYGTWVLNRFRKVGEKRTFTQLFGGMEKEEVARYFLSILMLTNTGNLKILQPSNGEKAVQLLKKERHHEELQSNVGNQVNKE